jgi:hypothetical protein
MAILKKRFPTAALTHPNYPSFVMTFRRQDKIEGLDFLATLQDHQVALAVKDGDTGTFVRDDDGKIEVHVKQNYPASAIFKQLKDVFVTWTGLTVEGENGEDVEVPFDEGKNLKYLFESDTDVIEMKEVEDKKTGVKSMKEVVTPCWQWVARELRRKDLFDADPKTSR